MTELNEDLYYRLRLIIDLDYNINYLQIMTLIINH